ncbi:hypothetical protein MA16_Dca004538 [Dendrobium catenatum]|uniref:Uncharacterized protein n=1 Tax=Dendrobium catenatum TaxID=906689 RepID=A0A2I0W7Q6_9ASPA|nr:hypothetical protein MA16_Dca004538 [Dendrobium catenatum]
MAGVDRRCSPPSNPSSLLISTLKPMLGSPLVIRDHPLVEILNGSRKKEFCSGKGKGLMVEKIDDQEKGRKELLH